MRAPGKQWKSLRGWLLATTLMGVAALAACGGGGGSSGGGGGATPPPPPPAGTGITVFPGTTTVAQGGKAVFTAFVPSAPTTTNFTWAVTGSGNGTITADGTGKGDYIAPTTAPAGPVTVTVTSGNLGGSATITISAAPAGGVAINPAAIAVPAGTGFQFSATVNGVTAVGTIWQVNGTNGGDTLHGMIDALGNYTAPAMPPPGGSTTITAITGAGSATSTAIVVFSNNSLSGAYTFSYTGDDGSGFLAVAGSFTAQSGTLTGGEDATDAQATSSKAMSGVYAIGPDGRGAMTIAGGVFQSGEIWQIALTANPTSSPGNPAQHAVLVRFDTNGSGSGTLDQQNTIEAVSPFPAGNYAFGLSGVDGAGFTDLPRGGHTLTAAGKFASNGVTTGSAAVWDLNDAGFSSTAGIVTDDTSLTATFTPSPSGFTGSVGRGSLNLFSTNATLNAMTGATPTSTFSFVFYVVDNTHVKVVENDGHAFLSGDVFSAPSGGFSQANVLKAGNYVFTLGGISTNGGYSAGGVFGANGAAQTSTGVLDINNGGVQISLDKPLSMSYSVDATLGRIAFMASSGTSNFQFAGYTASNGLVEMIELDNLAVSSGIAFRQTATSEPSGSFATDISGVAVTGQQDVSGQLSVNNGTLSGTLDLNDFGSGNVDRGLELITGTAIIAPDTNGRGTATLKTGAVTYQLAYYVIDSKTVLLMETDGVHVVLGTMGAQY